MPPKDADLQKLEPLAQAVLDACAAHPSSTLTDLYDPDLMRPNLRWAQRALDRTVERIYRRKCFASECERVVHLFTLYEKICTPLGVEFEEKAARPRRRKAMAGRTRA